MAIDDKHGRVIEFKGVQGNILDMRTGSVLHSVTLLHPPTNLNYTFVSSIAIDQLRGRALIGTILNRGQRTLLTILNTQTGQIQHSFSIPGVSLRVAVDGQTGHFLLATTGADISDCSLPCSHSSGQLLILDGRGRVLHTTAIQFWPLGFSVDSQTRRAYVVGQASLRVLDIQTGQLLHAIPLSIDSTPPIPAFVLIDSQANRALVVAQGSNGPSSSQNPIWNLLVAPIQKTTPLLRSAPRWTATLIDITGL